MNSIIIAGRSISLIPLDKKQLKGISIGETLSYRFFSGQLGGMQLVFAEPRHTEGTPRTLSAAKAHLEEKLGSPVVFLLAGCPAYLRQRLIDKGVHFVVSDKYAFTPALLVNERVRKQKKAERLTPAAQYLLLYHLQQESLEGMTARDLETRMPYSYATVALALSCLDDLGVCHKVTSGTKSKAIRFDLHGKDLWEKAMPFCISPVNQRLFCDELHSGTSYPTCGINALAHYTRLNPDTERMVAMGNKQLDELKARNAMTNMNEYDGKIMVESWKYPPVTREGWHGKWVDKLSLALSLRDDDDPRVEGEVEFLINNIEWKD